MQTFEIKLNDLYSARQKKLDKLSRRNNTLLVYRMTLKFDTYLDETFV